jgi:hypothetical protein
VDVRPVRSGERPVEQRLGERRQPFVVRPCRLLDDVSRSPSYDGLIVVEGVDYAAQQAGIGADRSEYFGGAPECTAISFAQALCDRGCFPGAGIIPFAGPSCSTTLLLPGLFLRPGG